MTFNPQPKPAPREKSAPSRIPKVSERHDPEFWRRLAARVRELHHDRCGACGKSAPSLDVAHIEPLGRGRSRNDADCPLNRVENLIALDRKCHEWFDRQTRNFRRMKGREIVAARETLPGHGSRRTFR